MNPDFYDLIAKVLSHEASPAETAALRQMCAADPAAQKAFEETAAVWAMAETVMPAFPVNKAAAWQKIQARTGMDEGASLPENFRKTKRFSLPVWTRWAAAAVVAALGTTLLLQQLPEKTQTIVAQADRQEVTLPDGSQVFLKKDARLQYTTAFARKQQRHVTLEGEAFFEVTKDPQHPFTIDAQKMRVAVVGTSFLVNTTAQEVSVRTGKVEVTQSEPGNALLLAAGEGVRLSGNKLQREVADSNDYFLKTGRIVFNNKSFEAIIGDISRILGVPVQIDASISTAGREQLVTYTAAAPSAEAVLTDLCRITGYQWRKEAGGYRIFQAR